MLVITALLLPVFAIPVLFNLSPFWETAFHFFDFGIWIAFYAEMLIKLIVSENYWVTFKKNWFLVLILLLPAFRIFRLVWLARYLRFIRLLRLQSLVDHLKENTRRLINNLEYVIIGLVSIILLASFLMWQIEKATGGAIDTFGDALWWSVITITTVGYGDIVPTTSGGKFFGAIISFIGVIIFMVVVAKITALFVVNREKKEGN
jgi:voltage-gated potassium channel